MVTASCQLEFTWCLIEGTARFHTAHFGISRGGSQLEAPQRRRQASRRPPSSLRAHVRGGPLVNHSVCVFSRTSIASIYTAALKPAPSTGRYTLPLHPLVGNQWSVYEGRGLERTEPYNCCVRRTNVLDLSPLGDTPYCERIGNL